MSSARRLPGGAPRSPDPDPAGRGREGHHAAGGLHLQPSLLHRGVFRGADGSSGSPRILEDEDAQIPSAAGAGSERSGNPADAVVPESQTDVAAHDGPTRKLCAEWDSTFSASSDLNKK